MPTEREIALENLVTSLAQAHDALERRVRVLEGLMRTHKHLITGSYTDPPRHVET